MANELRGDNIITIDGPAGSGKSTISRLLAKKIHWVYLDTGAMYRAVALAAKREGIPMDDGESLGRLCESMNLHFASTQEPPKLFLGLEDISQAIRRPDMDMLASKVSAVREVRQAMTRLQREMAQDIRVVAEGRDMGTVVFPEATFKFFLTASPEIRAERRYKERIGRGENISKKAVEADLKKRDHQDRTRSLAPLLPAKDAERIDSSNLSPDEVVEKIVSRLKRTSIMNF